VSKRHPKGSPRYKNPSFSKKLGDRCRKLRESKGYSIDRMYREGDQLSPGAIQRLESGGADVHVSLLYRYAEVLGIPAFELLRFEK
jgi:transcriptional regulator with XRE-family HTH domain